MSKSLNATKNRTTGNRSKSNFIAPLYGPLAGSMRTGLYFRLGPIWSQASAPPKGDKHGRTPSRAEIHVRGRARPRRLLVVPLRGFEKPAVLRRHAQGKRVRAGEIRGGQGRKALAVRLQAYPQPPFLRRHPQDPLILPYFFVAVQRPSAPLSVRNEPSMVLPVTRPVKSRRTPRLST